MGAKDLFKSLFFPQKKKKKQKIKSSPPHLKVVKETKPQENPSTLRDKKEIEWLKEKISREIQTPEGSKNAALIIEKMLNKK